MKPTNPAERKVVRSRDAAKHRSTTGYTPAWVSNRSWAGGVLDAALTLVPFKEDGEIRLMWAQVCCTRKTAEMLIGATGIGEVRVVNGRTYWHVRPGELPGLAAVAAHMRTKDGISKALLAAQFGTAHELGTRRNVGVRRFYRKLTEKYDKLMEQRNGRRVQ